MLKGTQHLNQKQKDQNQLSLIEAELATLEKSNSEMTSNFEKLKTEKEKLVKSDMKFKQLRDHMVMKICQDSSNFEDLESLMKLEPLELMAKFENVLSTKNSERIDITKLSHWIDVLMKDSFVQDMHNAYPYERFNKFPKNADSLCSRVSESTFNVGQ